MIDGFVIIDKPAGITSHDVVSRVRRILDTRKVGHTGTLDPFATGVLPVAVNDGTKAIPFLDEGLKCYEAVMQLGVVTDTLDMTGQVVRESDWRPVSREMIMAVMQRFTGRISQIPPMYSALKKDGQPLYKLARKGQVVERPPREIEIHSLDLLSLEPPLAGFKVACSRGTYVRTLADDIGSALGCGAALKVLRRTASGPFDVSRAVSLDRLESAARSGELAALTMSPAAALSHLPALPLGETGIARVRHGRAPAIGDLEAHVNRHCVVDGTLVRLTWQGELAAVAQCVNSGDEVCITLKRVFM